MTMVYTHNPSLSPIHTHFTYVYVYHERWWQMKWGGDNGGVKQVMVSKFAENGRDIGVDVGGGWDVN